VCNTCRNIERELQEGNGVKGEKIGKEVRENGRNEEEMKIETEKNLA
jgi:hypothetical protein